MWFRCLSSLLSIPHLCGTAASASLVQNFSWPECYGYPTGPLIERSPSIYAYCATLVLASPGDEIYLKLIRKALC